MYSPQQVAEFSSEPVTDAALANLPAQDLLRQLVTRVAQALAAENAALLLVSEDGQSLVVYLAEGAEQMQEGEVIVPIGQGIAGHIAAARRPLVVDDVGSAEMPNAQTLKGMRSLAGVPVIVQDRLLGVLHVDSSEPRSFTAEDVEMLQLVAQRIGLVMDNARLYAEQRQRSADLVAERDLLPRLLDVLPEDVVIYDAGMRVSAVNHVGEALFGTNVVGKTHRELDISFRLPDGTLVPQEQLPFMRALADGEAARSIRLVIRNGSTAEDVTALTSAAPLPDLDGAVTGAVAVLQDISPLLELERQRDRMLSMVTHDLRNPLTSISGMSQLLQPQVHHVEEPARDRFRRGLAIIEAAAARMMTQINDLLDHTRAQAGRSLELAVEAIDVLDLLRGVLAEHQHATDIHRLELRCTEESLVALVDRHRLERAIASPVVNAIKYSPEGGPVTVTVVRAAEPDGSWLSIEVTDNGLGIPSADLPHMFEQYYRASNVSASIPGNGIGLAGVRHVAQSHGGTVALESTEGVGTTVRLRLPFLQEALPHAAASA